MEETLNRLREQAVAAAKELLQKSKVPAGSIVVVGCSSSEISGSRIGSDSKPQVAQVVYEGIAQVFAEAGVYLAAQCCEHLNRALIVEREIYEKEIRFYASRVNVVPQPKAGGSFATAAYGAMKEPVAVEAVRADAGMDIGGTLIGMHLKRVAVVLRITVSVKQGFWRPERGFLSPAEAGPYMTKTCCKSFVNLPAID